MSSRKGNDYETELSKFLSATLGIDVSRTPLSGGGFSDVQMADLIGTPDIWVEAKRTQRADVYRAMQQAEEGIAARSCPDAAVVITRKNNVPTKNSLVVMRLDDWVDLYRAYLTLTGVIK